MNNQKENKMAIAPMNKLLWKMGLPMIISMVLQAMYNVVDSIFVSNMGASGALANQALTLAFPIQILIIAIGVGTGVGINAILSKSLGEKNEEKISKIAGNGIFLSIVIFIIFFLFGFFGSEWFIKLFANDNQEVIEMGTTYLRICTCFSLGSIGYTVYERFLQATGKTMLSTISQISGALTNIILDYVFIFSLNMGVAGAAWATIIGQFVSLFIAMYFHYSKNKEIKNGLCYLKPDKTLIKEIYKIGASATMMQALLAVMMAGVNAILNLAKVDQTILVGSFGIYYKIQQIALFAAFGLSNTIISILSFNYGMKDKTRSKECMKYGITATLIVTLVITILFQLFAHPLASLFGLAGESSKEVIEVCEIALHIASIGYIFMGYTVAIQGVLQSLGSALKPLILSLLRLVIFVFPVAYAFTLSDNVMNNVWWTFPIAEVLTAFVAFALLRVVEKEKINTLTEKKVGKNLVISISRCHGTNGKEIGKLVAKKLGIAFYDKEEIKEFAVSHNLSKDMNAEELYDNYLSLDANKDSIIKQKEVIRSIANDGDCVIIGRASDYVLKDNPNLISVFLYAPLEYRVKKVQELYGDTEKEAKKHIKESDERRKTYYELITNTTWGNKENYDLCINVKIGNKASADTIIEYVKKQKK